MGSPIFAISGRILTIFFLNRSEFLPESKYLGVLSDPLEVSLQVPLHDPFQVPHRHPLEVRVVISAGRNNNSRPGGRNWQKLAKTGLNRQKLA